MKQGGWWSFRALRLASGIRGKWQIWDLNRHWGFLVESRTDSKNTRRWRLDPDSITPEREARVLGLRHPHGLNRQPSLQFMSRIEDTAAGEANPLHLYQCRMGLLDQLIKASYVEPLNMAQWLREKGWSCTWTGQSPKTGDLLPYLSPPKEIFEEKR